MTCTADDWSEFTKTLQPRLRRQREWLSQWKELVPLTGASHALEQQLKDWATLTEPSRPLHQLDQQVNEVDSLVESGKGEDEIFTKS